MKQKWLNIFLFFFCNSFFNLVPNFSLATRYSILAMSSSQATCCQLTKEEPVNVYLILRIFLCEFFDSWGTSFQHPENYVCHSCSAFLSITSSQINTTFFEKQSI